MTPLETLISDSLAHLAADAKAIDDQIVADYIALYNAATPAFMASSFGQWLRQELLKRAPVEVPAPK
jgi:hypothetical protein